ncbi:MAG: hypothetical protein NT170_00780 [Candidatus Moranbacteria bacterium]|nr:hypothetical protein [Candidatus Moranbacteria bacterium]
MKTRKILSGAAVAFLAMAFFVGTVAPAAQADATTNMAASAAIGQQDLTSKNANQGGSADLNKLYNPRGMWSDGTKLIVADSINNRVLIYNSIPTENNANADVVIGQSNMTGHGNNQGGSAAANTLSDPFSVWSDGEKLLIADAGNNRVLIYNSIPTANNANADVAVGQPNKTGSTGNQGGGFTPAANTLYAPYGLHSDGQKLFIADWGNYRVLVYNSIPTTDNANADVVIGQQNMTTPAAGGSAAANTLSMPSEVFRFGNKLAITDRGNSRVLIYNSVPTSNGASADVAVGQANMTSGTANQGGSAAASTLNNVRGITFGGTKMFVGDTDNNRVLVYEVGAAYAIGKNQSTSLVLGEKMKVGKKNFQFSGTRVTLKKGRVRLLVAGSSQKLVKIGKNGKWSIKYNQKTDGVVRIKFKFYNSGGTDIQNSNDYFVQVSHNGSLTPVMLKSADFQPMSLSGSTKDKKSSEKINRSKMEW